MTSIRRAPHLQLRRSLAPGALEGLQASNPTPNLDRNSLDLSYYR